MNFICPHDYCSYQHKSGNEGDNNLFNDFGLNIAKIS